MDERVIRMMIAIEFMLKVIIGSTKDRKSRGLAMAGKMRRLLAKV
jgi:hypothetical protein